MRMTQMYKLNNVPSMTDADIFRELNEVIDIVIQLSKTPDGRIADSIYYKHANVKPS
jgi:type IV secretion system protein VirB11